MYPLHILIGQKPSATLTALYAMRRQVFAFDNKEGNGTWICKKCGAGDGMDLAMKFTGRDFPETARQIDQILGDAVGIKRDAPVVEISDERRTADRKRLWGSSRSHHAGLAG